jgi:polysaccharide export outer membrane protein
MKRRYWPGKAATIGLILSVGVLSMPAQERAAVDPTQAPPNPQLKLSPQKQLEKFEPAVDEEYELGAGDEINLNFPGRPELSGKYIVGPDGRITLPMAGPLLIVNQSRVNAAKTIVDALSPYYTNLTVTVGIDKYGSNKVIVLGNVQRPGALNFDDTPTLLDAISRAGLTSTPSNKDGIPDRCMVYRGNDQVLTVDLRSLIRSGNALADIRLRRNDIVFVPSQADLFVSVLGEVGHPGAVALTPESTLPSVLAQAGGLGEGAGSSPNIQIIQKSTNQTRIVPWKQLMTPSGISEVNLQPGDVIFVPKTGFYKATYFLQRLTPITSLMTIGAMAGLP